MQVTAKGKIYVAGMYGKSRTGSSLSVDRYLRAARALGQKVKPEKPGPAEMPPAICFSRKIGVGALEVADLLAEKIGFRVCDREILEHIAREGQISEDTVRLFDEVYPGKINELFTYLFGEKSFVNSDYSRILFSSVLSIAHLEPTIFVGRGTHLILPRDRTLAVRFIGGMAHRIDRLTRILNISEAEARKKLEDADREQRAFFKRVYGKKDAPPDEFDLIINFDFLKNPQWAAGIVESAFTCKFGDSAAKRK